MRSIFHPSKLPEAPNHFKIDITLLSKSINHEALSRQITSIKYSPYAPLFPIIHFCLSCHQKKYVKVPDSLVCLGSQRISCPASAPKIILLQIVRGPLTVRRPNSHYTILTFVVLSIWRIGRINHFIR